MSDIIIPSSPADIQKLKGMVDEAVNSKTRIQAENDQIKEIKDDIAETFELPKKIIGQMINTAYKQNLGEVEKDAEDLSELYEAIYGPQE